MVKFTNNDKCFFECSEAEARRAIDFLKNERFETEAGKRREAEIEELKKYYRKITDQIPTWIRQSYYAHLDAPLTPSVLNQIFAMNENVNGPGSVAYVIVHSTTYGEIRGWDARVYDEATETMKKNLSVFGHIWGAEIIVNNTVPQDLVILVGPETKATDKRQVKLFKLTRDNTKVKPDVVDMVEALSKQIDELKRTVGSGA